MAGYHYKLEIIPNAYEVKSDEEEHEFWENEQPQKEMLEKFRLLLPISKNFGYSEEFRSKENYSVLYIWWENNLVWSIGFEYAPTETKDILLTNVLNLCVDYGYSLFSEDTNVKVKPDKKSLWEDFKKCSRFHIYERRMDEFQ